MSKSVLMFGWEFPPHNSGGLGVACMGLTRELSKKGVNITFVLPKRMNLTSNSMKIIFADGEINVKELDILMYPYINTDQYDSLRSLVPFSIYGLSLFDEVKRYAKIARKIAQKQSFDLIHAHDWLSFPAGIEAKKVKGKPLIAHVHSTEFDRTGGNNLNAQVYEIEKEGLRQADKIIAVSNFTRSIIIDRYSIPNSKVEVIHNGIEASDYKVDISANALQSHKDLGYKIVLFAGRITLQKGPDYFIQVAKEVLKFNPKVIFVVAGSGDMERQIILQSSLMGISNNVIFTGFLRGEDLSSIYKSADLFVMPSVSEPFGIAPLESIIHQTPVLISKQSGVSEVITHALKSDFWDIQDLTDKILSALEYGSLENTLKDNSYKEAQALTWEKTAGKVLQLYSRIA